MSIVVIVGSLGVLLVISYGVLLVGWWLFVIFFMLGLLGLGVFIVIWMVWVGV